MRNTRGRRIPRCRSRSTSSNEEGSRPRHTGNAPGGRLHGPLRAPAGASGARSLATTSASWRQQSPMLHRWKTFGRLAHTNSAHSRGRLPAHARCRAASMPLPNRRFARFCARRPNHPARGGRLLCAMIPVDSWRPILLLRRVGGLFATLFGRLPHAARWLSASLSSPFRRADFCGANFRSLRVLRTE